MGDKEGKSKGDEEKKLSAILERYDALLPKVADTQKACDSLWKSYQVSFNFETNKRATLCLFASQKRLSFIAKMSHSLFI